MTEAHTVVPELKQRVIQNLAEEAQHVTATAESVLTDTRVVTDMYG